MGFPQNQVMFFIDNGNQNLGRYSMIPFVQMEQQKENYNPMNFETLSKKKVVNHIYGALYISMTQQVNKPVIEHKKVPVSTVNLDGGEDDDKFQQNKQKQPGEQNQTPPQNQTTNEEKSKEDTPKEEGNEEKSKDNNSPKQDEAKEKKGEQSENVDNSTKKEGETKNEHPKEGNASN